MSRSIRYLVGIGLAVALGAGCTGDGGSSTQRPKAVDRYVSAVQAHNRGDDARAIAELQTALQENPDLTMARTMLGDLYRANGEYAPAATQYEQATRLDPYSYQGQYKLGLMYQLLNRMQEAAAAYLKALKLNPHDVQTNMNLGMVYMALDQPDDAIYYTDRAVQLDPKSASAWANLGVALDSKGDYIRAEAAYRKSLDIDAKQVTTRLNLGTNLIQQQKGGEAVSVLQEVVRMEDSSMARRRLADALAREKQYDEAIREYNASLRLNPQNYAALNEIGRVSILQYRASFELDDAKRLAAIEAWTRSLRINPRQPRISAQIEQWTNQALFSTE